MTILLPRYQNIAMNRAEANGTLRVKLELDYARQVIPAGALVGEKAINYGFDRAWERANAGKLWKDVEKRLELE